MRMRTFVLWVVMLAGIGAQAPALVQAPRFWNDRELSDWATPVVGINVRPGHYSEKEYYAAPELEVVRTYAVYAPGREHAGYWQQMQNAEPDRLLNPGARTGAK